MQLLGTRRPGTGVSRARRARSVPGVSPRVSPETGGVPRSVRRGVCGALRAPGSGVSEKCSESVFGVSKRCPGHSGTLSGHFLDTPEPGTPPVFGDTLGDARGTLRVRSARRVPNAIVPLPWEDKAKGELAKPPPPRRGQQNFCCDPPAQPQTLITETVKHIRSSSKSWCLGARWK